MTEMAERYNLNIMQMLGKSGTSESTYIFRDGSKLQFNINTNPDAKADGRDNSLAKQFANDVATFAVIEGGYEFTFKDGSKFTVNLGTAMKRK